MADLKTTAEERAKLARCRSCGGRGMRDPHCYRCEDSGEDHECPPEVTCLACKGSKDNPEVRRLLDDLDTLLAENAKLRAVRLAAREYRAMCAPGLDMCRDLARDDLDAALAALEAP